jgi:hypothetical protein
MLLSTGRAPLSAARTQARAAPASVPTYQKVEVNVQTRGVELLREEWLPIVAVQRDVRNAKDVAGLLNSRRDQSRDAVAAERPHEVTKFKDDVLARAVGSVRERLVWTRTAIVCCHHDNRVRCVDSMPLELLDHCLAAIRLLLKDDCVKPQSL